MGGDDVVPVDQKQDAHGELLAGQTQPTSFHGDEVKTPGPQDPSVQAQNRGTKIDTDPVKPEGDEPTWGRPTRSSFDQHLPDSTHSVIKDLLSTSPPSSGFGGSPSARFDVETLHSEEKQQGERKQQEQSQWRQEQYEAANDDNTEDVMAWLPGGLGDEL